MYNFVLDLAKHEIETIKKLVTQRLDPEGADIVNGLIDKLNKKISSLEQICKNQDKTLQDIKESSSKVRLLYCNLANLACRNLIFQFLL